MQFNDTLGVGYLGSLFAAGLYGITCLQTFIYFQNGADDNRLVKYLVTALFLLDSVHMAVTAHSMYWYMVTNYTNPSAIGVIPWSLDAVILLTITSDTLVRSFFTYRIWILSGRNRGLSITLAILVAVAYVLGLVFAIRGFRITLFEEAANFLWTLDINMATVLFVDSVIAATLCYYLYKGRSTISHRTNVMLNVLIRYTINTGLATSIIMLVCLVTYATMPNNFVYIGVYFTLSKLYLNSLLASLNAREQIKMSGRATGPNTGTNTTMLFTSFPNITVTGTQATSAAEVHGIHVDVETAVYGK